MTPLLTAVHHAGMTSEGTLALERIEETKAEADSARDALHDAEARHHEAILTAATIEGVSISAIARAAGVSRTRIYRRFASPTYGVRSPDEPAYGSRPAAS